MIIFIDSDYLTLKIVFRIQNSIIVHKVIKSKIRKRYQKTLVTSVINFPMSPLPP